jgi:hypothetical protein
MAAVRDPNPVNRTQHNGFISTQYDDPSASQPKFIDALDLIISHGESKRWSGVNIKRDDAHACLRDRRS